MNKPTKSSPHSRNFALDSKGFVILLGFISAVQAMSTTLTLPALPAMAQAFSTTPDMVQFTLSGFLIGVACGQVLLGALSDRIGRRPVLLGGLVLTVVTGVGCTFAGNIEFLIAMRVLQGFGAAAGMILGRAIVRDAFPRDRALKAMAMIIVILGITPMIGPPLTGLLLEVISWRAVFGTLTVITAIITLMTYFRIGETLQEPDPRATDPTRILRNCRQMLVTPSAISFSLMSCLVYGGVYAYFSLISFIARDTFGLTGASAGWLVGAGALAVFAGANFNNRFSGRWPVRRILDFTSTLTVIGAFTTLAATLLVTYAHIGGALGLALIVIPGMIFAFNHGASQPSCIVMSLQPLPHIAGTASALGASFQTLSGALFSTLAAALYNGTPVSLGLCMVLAGLLSLGIYRGVARAHSPH